MKKVFLVMAVAALGFVACNNEDASTPTPASDTPATEVPVEAPAAPQDSIPATQDSLPPAPPVEAAPAQ